MSKNFVLQCNGCGAKYSFGTYSCKCNKGVLLAEYNFKKINSIKNLIDCSKPGIWKFSKVLPELEEYYSYFEGETPCIKSRFVGPKNGIALYIKDEGRNPTGSFKDRAAAILVSSEKELGHLCATTASSGNAAGALSLYSALAGIELYIFMFQPPEEKLLHNLSFGHHIFLVQSTQESDAIKIAETASKEFGWACLTTMSSANPFNVEGYKTISYEIFFDIGIPDFVFIPMGSGTLALGIWKGFKELFQMGFIYKIPCLVGVQSEQVNPIDLAYQNNDSEVKAVIPKKTIATGVVTDDPGISGMAALKAIRETKGFTISVSEEKLVDTFSLLPQKEGIFAEPTGALSIAGLILACERGLIEKERKIVCINSASGFKDLEIIKKIFYKKDNVSTISPDINFVKQKLKLK